LGSIST